MEKQLFFSFLFAILGIQFCIAQNTESIFRVKASNIKIVLTNDEVLEGTFHSISDSTLLYIANVRRNESIRRNDFTVKEVLFENISRIKLKKRGRRGKAMFIAMGLALPLQVFQGYRLAITSFSYSPSLPPNLGVSLIFGIPTAIVAGIVGLVVGPIPNNIELKGRSKISRKEHKIFEKHQLILEPR